MPWEYSAPVTGIAWEPATARLSVVGPGAVSDMRVRARMLRSLSALGIAIDTVVAAGRRVSCTVSRSDAPRAMRALHPALDLDTGDRLANGVGAGRWTAVEQHAGWIAPHGLRRLRSPIT